MKRVNISDAVEIFHRSLPFNSAWQLVPLGLIALLLNAFMSEAFGQPYVATQAAGPVSRTNATLNGMVTPRGSSTVCWFEWGTNSSYGQATSLQAAGNGSNVVRVSAVLDNLLTNSVYRFRLVASNSVGTTYGMEQRCTTGHRVATWGEAGFSPLGTIWPPQDIGEVVGMGAGDYHGLAIKADGRVVAWGAYYLVGGSVTPPPDLNNVVAVAGGRDHSMALRNDGTVVVWGQNPNGQTNVPSGLSNVVAISAGDAHSLALRSDGFVVGWGQFNFGIPMSIPIGLSNVVAISSGDRYCLALRNNGTVIAWGQNISGEASVPAGLGNVIAVVAGYTHSIALKSNRTVVVWGNDAAASVPSGLSNVVQIASGDQHCIVLLADGTVTTWGWPVFGGKTPTGLADVANLTCGDFYSMALAANIPPSFSSKTLSGPLNHDSTLALGTMTGYDRDPNNDPLTWRIGSLPSSGALYQLATVGRGDLISTNDTPITDSSGRVVFAPDLDEFGAPYTTFTFIANDGNLDSQPATATVNIVPSPTASVSAETNNSISTATIRFVGLSNASYSVWGSTNLFDWSRLGAASQPTPEQFLYTDTSVTNFPSQFYRVRSP